MAAQYSNTEQREKAERQAFSRRADDALYARMVGLEWPTDGDVMVRFMHPWSHCDTPPPVTIQRRDETVTLVLRVLPGWVDLSDITIHDPGNGIGRQLLLRVFTVLNEMGFQRVRCDGKKSAELAIAPEAYGHYAMPRFGFECDLPVAVRTNLPHELAQCTTISQLLATEGGREYWKLNGVTLTDLVFDLSDDSPSWSILQNR